VGMRKSEIGKERLIPERERERDFEIDNIETKKNEIE